MKISVALFLLSSILPVACGQISQSEQAINAAQSAVSSDESAANQIYLDDVSDSAADTSTSTPADGTTTEDSTTAEDTKDSHLDHMVTKVFAELDTDASGSLTLAEFLVGPKKRADDTAVDATVKAQIETKMTADFNANAGDDALLSSAELKALLKGAAPRVGQHRQGKGEDQSRHEERIKQTASEIIAKYDADADGKLDATEIEAMQAAIQAEVKAFREKNGEGNRGRGHDRGGPGEQGPD